MTKRCPECRYKMEEHGILDNNDVYYCDVCGVYRSYPLEIEEPLFAAETKGACPCGGNCACKRAETSKLKRDSCCCGATKSKPCACMIQGVMKCSMSEPQCPCYQDLEKKSESLDAEKGSLAVWAKDMEKDHVGYFVSKNKDGWETWKGLCGITTDKGVSRGFDISKYDGSYGRRCRKCLTAYKKMGAESFAAWKNLAGNLGGRQPENTFTRMPPLPDTTISMVNCVQCKREDFADNVDLDGVCKKCIKYGWPRPQSEVFIPEELKVAASESFNAEAYWFLKGEIENRHQRSTKGDKTLYTMNASDIEQIVEMLQNVPPEQLAEARRKAVEFGDMVAKYYIMLAQSQQKFREDYSAESHWEKVYNIPSQECSSCGKEKKSFCDDCVEYYCSDCEQGDDDHRVVVFSDKNRYCHFSKPMRHYPWYAPLVIPKGNCECKYHKDKESFEAESFRADEDDEVEAGKYHITWKDGKKGVTFDFDGGDAYHFDDEWTDRFWDASNPHVTEASEKKRGWFGAEERFCDVKEEIKNLSPTTYKEFCIRFGIDPKDDEHMTWFISNAYTEGNPEYLCYWIKKLQKWEESGYRIWGDASDYGAEEESVDWQGHDTCVECGNWEIPLSSDEFEEGATDYFFSCAECDFSWNVAIRTDEHEDGASASSDYVGFMDEDGNTQWTPQPFNQRGDPNPAYKKGAESFNAVVIAPEKPKGAVERAMMNHYLLKEGELRHALEVLENELALGIISEREAHQRFEEIVKTHMERRYSESEVSTTGRKTLTSGVFMLVSVASLWRAVTVTENDYLFPNERKWMSILGSAAIGLGILALKGDSILAAVGE